MNIRGVLLLIPLIGLFVLLTGQTACGQEDDDPDPVWVIWETYMSQRDGLSSLDVWFDKIMEVVDKNPQSPACYSVLYGLVGSCNSTRNFEKSAKLLERLLTMDASIYLSLKTLGQLGAVQKEMYLAAVSTNDTASMEKYADLTLQTYQRYHDKLYSADTKAKLSSGEFSNLQGYLIYYLRTQSEILSSVKKDKKGAVAKSDEAIKILESNPNLTRQGVLQGMGFDTALFQKDKAAALIESGNVDDAIKAMLDYGKAPSEKEPIKSAAARQFAKIAFPEKNDEYRKFLQLWLDSVPQDSETVVVLRDIGRSFFDEKKYTETIDVLENIRNNWWQKILTLDKISLERQKGGYCSDVLRMLGQCYQKTGLVEKSAQCIAELKTLVPQDLWIHMLETNQGQAEVEAERREVMAQIQQKSDTSRYRWTTVIVVNTILIALIVYFMLRRKHKG
ncbi:MAG: hypothetical protein LBU65_13490 [Planctomycetaceae bacterium]|jgi:tetratricopeptide (TPR) repeat protein|nr:hypothetical protein [Planctomycetaceae bacterium]